MTDIGSNLVNISEITFQSCALDKPGCGRGDVRDAINLAIRWGKVYSVDKMTSLNGTKSACIGNNETDVDVSKIAGVYTAYDASPSFLKQLLFNDGPLAVTIRANRNFSNYTGGILKSKDCSARDSDRKIDALLVGYGVDYLDGPYWILVSTSNLSSTVANSRLSTNQSIRKIHGAPSGARMDTSGSREPRTHVV